MPTVVAVPDPGQLVVGEPAEGYPERQLIRSVKTALAEGKTTAIVQTDGGKPFEVSVDQIVEDVLTEAVRRSQANGLDLVARPVRMACPAHWTAEPRVRLLKCAAAAGLQTTIGDLLDEPIAAGISWIMHKLSSTGAPPEGRVVVFDAGGGTLDVAVLDVKAAIPPEITVLSSISIPEAGDRLDQTIASALEAELLDSGDLTSPVDPVLSHLLRLAGRRLKEHLSYVEESTTAVGGGYDHLRPLHYTRHQLESVFAPQLQQAISLIDGALKGAELRRRDAANPSDIRHMRVEPLRRAVDWIVLSGGMSRMPAIHARLAATFPGATVEADPGLGDPEESVVTGLAFDDVVSQLNLHRPAFDFVATYRRAQDKELLGEQILYPAFSPLYQPDQVLRGEGRLGFASPLTRPSGWGDVVAEVTCRALDGTPLELHVDNHPVAAIAVPLPPSGHGRFKLYADGRIIISGQIERQLRVERWPIIRSHGGPNPLQFTTHRSGDRNDDRPDNWWMGGQY
jgi:hypothetical protein